MIDLNDYKKDNYLTNWMRKNISTDILEARVYCKYGQGDIKVNKSYIDNSSEEILLVYENHMIQITNSEWGTIERIQQ